MRLLRDSGESGIRTHEGLHPTAFRERHFRPLRHLSTPEYSITLMLWQAKYSFAPHGCCKHKHKKALSREGIKEELFHLKKRFMGQNSMDARYAIGNLRHM